LQSKEIYTGTLSKANSLPHGRGKIEYIETKTGQWYEGDWINGTPIGYGSRCIGNGDLYEGSFYWDTLTVLEFGDSTRKSWWVNSFGVKWFMGS
jgi:hypothetical protein